MRTVSMKVKKDNTPRRRASLTKRRSRVVPVRTTSANVRVVVRVRPLNEREQGDAARKTVVEVIDDQMLVFDPKEKSQPFFYQGVQQKGRDLMKKTNKDIQFMFDKVFGYEADNQTVFKSSTFALIDSLMEGYNCSVFAYGATGAGKTYTMIGNSENPGITYLTMAELFKRKEQLSIEREFELGITYLEVYNELVQDLLNPGAQLHLREDVKYGVVVSGIKVSKIDSPDDLFALLEQGNKNRTQHPTDANAESSRSHAVFQVYIHMKIKGTEEVRTAKLSMIDLAGSERGSATGCSGARFTEGANINKSLLALGNCINSLADGLSHVPYRDSKLTRLLKDSLGGNCQTVMIANVSPAAGSYEDTYNTLRYATRAKKIKSTTRRNVVSVEMHVGNYVKMIDELKAEVLLLKKQLTERPLQLPKLSVEGLEEAPQAKALVQLYDQKAKLMERKFQIESIKLGMSIRQQFKEDANTRLSGIIIDTPEKELTHRKLGDIVERFQNKGLACTGELSSVEREIGDVDANIMEMIRKHPELESVSKNQISKLNLLDAKQKSELAIKEKDIWKNELYNYVDLSQNMALFLKKSYKVLKGHGLASDSYEKEYQSLSKHFGSTKSITWSEDVTDSGLSSTSSLQTLKSSEVTSPNEEELNGTFTLPVPKPPRVQQIVSKGGCKRLGTVPPARSRLKENWNRNVLPPTRFKAYRSDIKIRTPTKPPFRT